jgi:DNA-binding transcriptional ArsR family regulator
MIRKMESMQNRNELIENKDIQELAGMLKAMAHPSRMAIMLLLCNARDKRMAVKDIYSDLKMPQPVISRHLGILKNSGLLKRIMKDSKIFYEMYLDNKNAKHIEECLSSLKDK